ncbi:MAG TPA: beta-galactosidase [Candidatus Paceibacterota bacterium]|nr:beta-galactosidase [Verrucomicrobiota bacterium]HRY51586.1 beta-galactosidase [Candidatus Paceibacterota bacterium]HSA01810.1 beta-galactosidase [Candidatus Paceibacterota bacterium]
MHSAIRRFVFGFRVLFSVAFIGCVVLAADGPATERANPPVIITAGNEWIPLRPELDIVAGSALDFSGMGLSDAPAGKHGRVIARPDGQFAFADAPDRPCRFYGVNLCFGAQYLSHEESDRLAERLVKLGYNALRIHHYERDLTQGQKPTTTLNSQKLEQFDYLMWAMIRRGIYVTTDLFVSRSVPFREVGMDRDGQIPMDTFKILVPVHEGAYENWKHFARALLGHENPYTTRRYANEPALAWLAMINEGNFGNFFKDIQTIPEWKQAWNRWLTKRYGTRPALASAWGTDLKADEDPAKQTVGLPERLQAEGLRARDCVAFLSDTEREMVLKMRTFLRDELDCRALISNASSWTRFTTDQSARAIYDYVDDHFYVDHPQFLEGSWRLPSRCPNTSPIAEGATGGRTITFTRLFDKPFTLTEYNYSGPGRFRGVGGILTGAMGALQGWGGIWRFAYSHSREAMFTPSRMGYFDMASDPLSQAAERASICLFLRGDLQTAPHSVALVMTDADLAKPAAKISTLAPKWHWLAWITRIGSQVVPGADAPLSHTAILPLAWQTPASAYASKAVLPLEPYGVDNDRLLAALRERGVYLADNAPDPARKFFRSETGEVTIDGPGDRLILDTPRTAGGFAPVGKSIDAQKGGVVISISGSDATVWVSALDQNEIRRSKRLLVTHLTDLQNTEIQYAEPARQTLQNWGRLPYLVRAGKADVRIRLASPKAYHVWALAPSGKRLAEVPVVVKDDTFEFTTDVAADPNSGARMIYEVTAD